MAKRSVIFVIPKNEENTLAAFCSYKRSATYLVTMSCSAPYIIWEKIKQYEIEIVKRRCSSSEIAWHKPKVIESDYFYKNGKKMTIKQWDTYIMNLADDHYREIVLAKVKQRIVEKGIDGVFLDTVGDIDDYFCNQPVIQENFRNAYVTLLKEIKNIDSSLLLVQNWGFETVKSTSLNLIHAVLWEDFNKQVIANDEWSQNWMRYFKQQKNKIVTFTVAPDDISKEYSFTNGFISTINPNDIYDK